MSKLLVVGNDKLGRRLLAQLGEQDDIRIVIDASTKPKRVWKLIKRGSLTLTLVMKMVLAEFLRKDYQVPQYQKIYSNADLLRLIKLYEVEEVYLFRAGLIINKKVIDSEAKIINTHCARIPDYGGLGSIIKALKDGAYEQEATLHEVTIKIDEGETVAIQPYRLSKTLFYHQNEEIAYNAGIELLLRQLGMKQTNEFSTSNQKYPPPSDQDLEIWQQQHNNDLVDWLYTGVTGRFQIAGHQQIDHWAVKYANKVVVEVGSGHGHHLYYGKNHYKQYIGLDIEPKFLLTLQKRFAGTSVINGDAYNLPFEDCSVNCVFSVYNFEHLRQLPDSLTEIRRVLKPDGELLIGLLAEGGLLYEVGRRLTSKRYMERKYGIDYMSIVHWEHWNTSGEVLEMVEKQFTILERCFIPFQLLPTVHANVIGCVRARIKHDI